MDLTLGTASPKLDVPYIGWMEVHEIQWAASHSRRTRRPPIWVGGGFYFCVKIAKIRNVKSKKKKSATLFKKSPWRRCFPVNFAKFLRTPFSQNTSGRLLLHVAKSIALDNVQIPLQPNWHLLIQSHQ